MTGDLTVKHHGSKKSDRLSTRILDLLTEPSAYIQDENERRRVQFYSVMLLLGALTFIIPHLIRGFIDGRLAFYNVPVSVSLIVAYALSRTRRYEIGLVLFLAVYSIIPTTGLVSRGDYSAIGIYSTLIWSIPVLLLASIVIPPKRTLVLCAMNVLVILLLPTFIADVQFIYTIGPLGIVLCVSTLAVGGAAIRHNYLNRIEQQSLELAEREASFQGLFRNAPDAIMVIDSSAIIAECNVADEALLGYGREEIMGCDIASFFDEDGKTTFKQELPVLREKGIIEGEAQLVRKDKTHIPVWFRASALHDNESNFAGAVCHIRDMTEVKAMEQQTNRQRRELELYTQLLTHDISNDLQVAQGEIELTLLQLPSKVDVSHRLITSMAAMKRIDSLVKAFTDTSDFTEKCDFITLLERLGSQAEKISSGLEVRVHATQNAKGIRFDAFRLLPMIFENLLRNAVTHAGEKPKVTISVQLIGSHVSVRVIDNGPGIAPEMRERLFQKGTSSGRGSGMGLYLTKQILKTWGGSIDLLEEGDIDGAGFIITIPLET